MLQSNDVKPLAPLLAALVAAGCSFPDPIDDPSCVGTCETAGPDCGEHYCSAWYGAVEIEGSRPADQQNLPGLPPTPYAPLATARGGRQTLRVLQPMALSASMLPMDLRGFEPVTDGSALTVEVDGPNLVARAVHAGTSRLDLLEPDHELLLEQELVSIPIGEATIRPLYMFGSDVDFAASHGWAVFTPGSAELMIELAAGPSDDATSNARLVDESMTADVSTTALAHATELGWDLLELDAEAAGTAVVRALAGDGVARDLDVEIVDSIDDVTWGSSPSDPNAPLVVDDHALYCMRALSSGVLVVGAAMTVTSSTSHVSITESLPGCVDVHAVSVGSAALSVTVGGHVETFDVTVVDG